MIGEIGDFWFHYVQDKLLVIPLALLLVMGIWGVQLPLQYEHTVLHTEKSGQLWIQFDVTGLPLTETTDPRFPYLDRERVTLNGEDRKLVQLLVRQKNETSEMLTLLKGPDIL